MSVPSDALLEQEEVGTHIENFIANTDKKGKAAQTLELLSSRLQLLESYWKSVSSRHGQVCRENADLKTSHNYFKNNLYYVYEDAYVEAKTELAARMAVLASVNQANVSASSLGGPSIQLLPQPPALPALKLPTFSGDQRDWEPFKELFCSMVKDVPNIANVQKIQRLLSCVEGKAAARLKGIQPISGNFDVAWNILMQSYDNKRVKLADLFKRLFSLPSMHKVSVQEITKLLDTVDEAIRSMTTLGRPVESWDDWFVQLVEMRLDQETRVDWEKSIESRDDYPLYADLKRFLEHRCRTLEKACAMEGDSVKGFSKVSGGESRPVLQKKGNMRSTSVHTTQVSTGPDDFKAKSKAPCTMCQGKHFLSYCPSFLNCDSEKRWKFVKQTGLCFNCLRPNHASGACTSGQRCRVDKCNGLHHTFLHTDKTAKSVPSAFSSSDGLASSATASHHTNVTGEHSHAYGSSVTLMATARVVLTTITGEMLVRALVDPASERSFVSERVVQALRLKKRRSCTQVTGVGADESAKTVGEVDISVRSNLATDFQLHFTALVLPRLTSSLPGHSIKKGDWTHIAGLELADPRYFVPGGIDCLLGGDVYNVLVLDGLRKGAADEPIAQNTVFGWVLTGPTVSSYFAVLPKTIRCFHTTLSCCKLRDELRRFWEQQEVLGVSHLSAAEQQCEDHFVKTHSRDESGRYVLRLPFSQTPSFPGSLGIATSRLIGSERRYQKKPRERQAYAAFMKEYQDLGHLEKVPVEELASPSCYYIPHHAVFKSDGSGKIRVVFNASQATENNLSLNDCLHAGPKLQTDITVILSRWRFHRYVFSADIVKMFRQFSIHFEDRNWLRILWRESPGEAIQHFRLSTVTYGTACAPFQAIRTLQQLAIDERHRFPFAAAVLEANTYVDDAFAGADTVEQALQVRDQLIAILRSAGMELDKWTANDASLLLSLSDVDMQDRRLDEDEVVSTLGLRWRPARDVFCFRVKLTDPISTKRGLLSVVAKLFDPVGWLSPVIIRAKILIQQLWLQGCDWDQELDNEIRADWMIFMEQLPDIESITIPRFFGCTSSPVWYLHGFSDASERAYAASLYLVTTDQENRWMSSLIAAKSRVSPIKTVSIPRLELCGALLLARMVAALLPQFPHPPLSTFAWSDSTVTLAWLRDQPSRWTTYVANRVSEIHTLLPNVCWNHVRSEDNPADCASRGLAPAQLRDLSLWWHGPSWLAQDWAIWEAPNTEFFSSEERKHQQVATHHVAQTSSFEVFVSRFSSLNRLIHVFAYILRLKARAKKEYTSLTGPVLSAEELSSAFRGVLAKIQHEFFDEDLRSLRSGRALSRKSSIRRCLPFIDKFGILRVGGRLQNFGLPYEEKHPALVPRKSHLSMLLLRDAHARTLHGGPQLVLSYLRRRYWIPQARNDVRRMVRSCIRCTRFNGRVEEQQMAPLPSSRGTPARPFATCGLDYAGPFPVRTSKGRGQKSTKGYVCLFVCFATRAVHLEVVSDLSTQMFLAAFRRFISRRGLCHSVHSDNGTNFQGASSELDKLFSSASTFSVEVATALANDGISWHFIPPRAPHFGGLWESGVKSFKHHLKRVVGDATLTFEEFSTVTAQIEACLNSRPLSPLSNDSEDLTALTPGHFLIGASLIALPEPSDFSVNVAGVPRYTLATCMRNHFWRRWQKEVLHQYQLRSKWLATNSTLRTGDLVLITDISLPATKWPLARVLDVHVGRDGLSRVATLKTATTTKTRPFIKLVRLPVEPDAITVGGSHPSIAGGNEDVAAFQEADSEGDQLHR